MHFDVVCQTTTSAAHQMEPRSPTQALGVNPFPSRVINRTIFSYNALESHECACCLLSFLYFHWFFPLLARETSSGNRSINKSTRERVDSKVWEMEAPSDGLLLIYIFGPGNGKKFWVDIPHDAGNQFSLFVRKNLHVKFTLPWARAAQRFTDDFICSEVSSDQHARRMCQRKTNYSFLTFRRSYCTLFVWFCY